MTTPIEIEAKLIPPGNTWRLGGEVEYELHPDGFESFEVFVSRLDVPNGAAVTVRRNGESLAEVAVRGLFRRHGRLYVSSRKGDEVPRLNVGDAIEVVYGGQLLLTGVATID